MNGIEPPHLASLIYYAVALIIAVLATARITRLFTYDHMPLFVSLRNVWDRWTTNEQGVPSDWNLLLHCQFCAAVWIAPAVVLSGWLSGLHTAWWLVCGTLAVSYLAATYMSYDGED